MAQTYDPSAPLKKGGLEPGALAVLRASSKATNPEGFSNQKACTT